MLMIIASQGDAVKGESRPGALKSNKDEYPFSQ